MTITAIITAAGCGVRSGLKSNKVLAKAEDGKTFLEKAAESFDRDERITQIIFTSNQNDFSDIEKIAKGLKTPCFTVLGGKTRSVSVFNALKKAEGEIVLVHDGARPFVSTEVVNNCINGVIKNGSAVAAVACVDTVADTNDNGEIIKSTRKNRAIIQTPQGFYLKKLLSAFEKAEENGVLSEFTDESGIYSAFFEKAHICDGDKKNIKLTYPEDFAFAKTDFSAETKSDLRAGVGYDVHKLVENRNLILGGVTIPHDKGLLGHSDADALTHAIMDALLSAAALRDIGYYFSDKDPSFKDISSMVLLEKVLRLLADEGYKPHNVSAVIQAQKPKLSPYVPQIRENLAKAMGVPVSAVGISCTTTEGIGFIGREEGIASTAYCTIEKIPLPR